MAVARALIERWRQDYNPMRPHSVYGGLTPQAALTRSAGARLRNRDQLRRSPHRGGGEGGISNPGLSLLVTDQGGAGTRFA